MIYVVKDLVIVVTYRYTLEHIRAINLIWCKNVCGKGFSHNFKLQNHIGTHTGDTLYKCDICGKGYSQKDHLQRHIRTHTGDKHV